MEGAYRNWTYIESQEIELIALQINKHTIHI